MRHTSKRTIRIIFTVTFVWNAYKNENFTSAPEAVAWLKSRIGDRFPGEAVSWLDIVWHKATYEAADESAIEYEPSYTVRRCSSPRMASPTA